MFQSFQNVRKVVDNSIKLLKDAEALLAEKGYVPILGNGLATESSKSILQSSDSYATLIPHYIARPYALKDQFLGEKVDHLLIINIQYTHPLHKNLHPVIITGRLSFEMSTDKVRSIFDPWLMKHAVFETELKIDENSQEKYVCTPFRECEDEIKFYIAPLTSIQTRNDITTLIEKLYII